MGAEAGQCSFELVNPVATSEHAAAMIRRFVAEEMLVEVCHELGVEQAELRAALAASQLVGIAITRYAVRVEALVDAGPDELTGWIAPTLQRYLTGRKP